MRAQIHLSTSLHNTAMSKVPVCDKVAKLAQLLEQVQPGSCKTKCSRDCIGGECVLLLTLIEPARGRYNRKFWNQGEENSKITLCRPYTLYRERSAVHGKKRKTETKVHKRRTLHQVFAWDTSPRSSCYLVFCRLHKQQGIARLPCRREV